MIKKGLSVLLVAVGLSSCLDDPVESNITILGKEQEKIMAEYVAANGLNAEKRALYSSTGDYFPFYTIIQTKGDTVSTVMQNSAQWVAYTIRTLDNRVVETVTEEDSVLLYENGYSGKILGLGVCGSNFLGRGGIGTFLIPSTLGYGAQPPGGVEANAVLVADLRIIDKLNESQQIAFFKEKNNFVPTVTTESGLQFKRTTTTTDSLVSGTSATVIYTGKFANGHVFDKSSSTGATFTLSNVVPGFSEAIKLMRVGEKATAILPSKIAYGEDGGGVMPVYMPLIFEIEVLSFN